MQSDNNGPNQYTNGFEYGVKHILSPRSGMLNEILTSDLQLPSSVVNELLQLGSIYLEGVRTRETKEIPEGAYIRAHTKPRRFLKNDFNWKERLVFLDDNFLVVKKPAGLPVHPSVDNCLENLQMYLADFLKEDLFVTHRLDVPTSGLIVYARNREFLALFNHLLASREIKKFYRARVQGNKLSEGLVTHYMEPSPRAPKTVSSEQHPNWQECQLRILSIQTFEEANEQEVSIELLTGRTHQIRAQLSALGAPICGDVMYGATKKYDLEKIDLEAETLEFLDFKFTTKPL